MLQSMLAETQTMDRNHEEHANAEEAEVRCLPRDTLLGEWLELFEQLSHKRVSSTQATSRPKRAVAQHMHDRRTLI